MRNYMRVLSGLAFSLCLPFFLRAADAPPATMTKIVVRLSGPHIKTGSIAAMPKTIYRAGPHYARIEDPPDSRQGIQKLTIIAEPDAYSVNLIDKKGTHAIDQGGSDDIHLPVVFDPTRKLTALNRLEFGEEFSFFQAHGATKITGPIINSKPTDAYQLKTSEGTATLVVRGGTHTPVLLSWQTKDGTYRYEYITYQQMPFDPALFAKPKGIRYRELPPDDNSEPG